jgi:hypothetical protein
MSLRERVKIRAQWAVDCLLRNVSIVSCVLVALGLLYVLALPLLTKKTFIDEPALLPGVAFPTIRYGFGTVIGRQCTYQGCAHISKTFSEEV